MTYWEQLEQKSKKELLEIILSGKHSRLQATGERKEKLEKDLIKLTKVTLVTVALCTERQH